MGNAIGKWSAIDPPRGFDYPLWTCSFKREGRAPMRFVLARSPDQREHAAVSIAAILVSHFQPRCLAMCGVCAGHPDEVTLGDVIVADRVWKYDAGELKRNAGDRDAHWLPDMETYQLYKPWKLAIESFDFKLPLGADWLAERSDGGAGWKVHIGGMATGANLVRDPSIWNRLVTTQNRKVLGIEMEASAIGWLKEALDVPRLLIAKGVMDHADPAKSDKARRFAAHASAEVLIQFLLATLDGSVASPQFPELLSSNQVSRPKQNINPGTLLTARYEIVPFQREGREQAIDTLQDWCAEDSPLGVHVQLITGDGGAGKTRLLIEHAKLLRARGWEAGFLHADANAVTVYKLLTSDRPLLVVIDYAESRSQLLALLKAFSESQPLTIPVRVALLARERADWWAALSHVDSSVHDLLASAHYLAVPALTARDSVRDKLFRLAATCFATALHKSAPTTIPDLSDDRFGRPLYVHMAALASLQSLSAQADTLLDTIVSHETHFWLMHLGEQAGTSLIEKEDFSKRASRLVAALTLRGGAQTLNALTLLSTRIEGPSQKFFPHFLHTLYPPDVEQAEQYVGVLEPDLLGERLIARVGHDNTTASNFFESVFEDGDDSAIIHGLWTLGRISTRDEIATKWIRDVISPNLENRAIPALFAALALGRETAVARIGTALSQLLESKGGSEKLAQQIKSAVIQYDSVSLARVRAWAARKVSLSIAPAEDESALEKHASELSADAIWLQRAGDPERALALAQAAVGIRRRLRQADPASHSLNLAISLNNLGNDLRELGKRSASFTAITEAVELHRRLARGGQHPSPADFAMSLSNFGNSLGTMNAPAKALQPTREAVKIFRKLARQNPERYSVELAGSLNNLGSQLFYLKNYPRAMSIFRVSMNIRRQLAFAHPDAHEPEYAMSLSNYGSLLKKMDKGDAAFPFLDESVAIFRKLNSTNPDKYRRYLAGTLYLLSMALDAPSQLADSLSVASESLSLHMLLYDSYPDAYFSEFMQSASRYKYLFEQLKPGSPRSDLLIQAEKLFQRHAIKPGVEFI
ncbi:MAG: tetratricopeptide repeat protein [Phycisphaerales bacterium]